jgi:subtilisin-like proprotein convertase family protein
MKSIERIIAAATLAIIFGASPPAAATLSFSTSDGTTYLGGASGLNQVIPDNTPSGVAYSINFAASGLNINNISVTFNLSGGYNNDIYAYLSHGSQMAVLLNQISGTAGSGSGFNVTLVEGTANPIQTASGTAGVVLSGTTFTAVNDLATFNNTDPNGNWTIFFADLNPGDTSTLNSFSLDITAVPEPVNMALMIVSGLATLCWLGQRWLGSSSQVEKQMELDGEC